MQPRCQSAALCEDCKDELEVFVSDNEQKDPVGTVKVDMQPASLVACPASGGDAMLLVQGVMD